MNKKMTGQEAELIDHDQLFDAIMRFAERRLDGYIFIETGVRWEHYVKDRFVASRMHNVKSFKIWYKNGKHQNVLVAGTSSPEYFYLIDPASFRGADVSKHVISTVARKDRIVFDPCCGMGYTARAALAADMRFFGNELNKKRLEKTIAILQR